MLNVFTRSRHAPYSDAAFVHENDQLSYVSAMRLREDEVFLRRITHDLPKGLKSNLQKVDLNLKDAPIRLRLSAEESCTTPVNLADPAIEKIRKALTRYTEDGAMHAMVLPAAIGGDVDHLTVREAALPFIATLPSAFYEDLPYAANLTSVDPDLDGLRAATSAIQQPLSFILCQSEDAVERKQALVVGYASQIDAEAGKLIGNFAARYGGGERLWGNPAWCSLAGNDRLGVTAG